MYVCSHAAVQVKTNKVFIRDCTLIHPLTLLLFAGKSIDVIYIVNNNVAYLQSRDLSKLNQYASIRPEVILYIHVLMRDEKEGRKKQARLNKQQGKATQHTQGSHFSSEK